MSAAPLPDSRRITAPEFEERLAALCTGGGVRPFTRRHRDRHILYRSFVQTLDAAKKYSEAMVNAELQYWLSGVGAGLDIDHVTLRRYLVDEAYLRRNETGSDYEVNLRGRGLVEFAATVADVDSSAVIQAAKFRVAERKREHASPELRPEV